MRVGVSGHQARPGIDWHWVAEAIDAELEKLSGVTQALTSLAVGSDQVFAQCAMDRQISVLAVIPIQDYERFFQDEGLQTYNLILAKSDRVDLNDFSDPERAFYAAGKYVVEHCDMLFAVWDGKPAAGLGGTGDAVAYAKELGKSCIIIDPIGKTVRHSGQE